MPFGPETAKYGPINDEDLVDVVVWSEGEEDASSKRYTSRLPLNQKTTLLLFTTIASTILVLVMVISLLPPSHIATATAATTHQIPPPNSHPAHYDSQSQYIDCGNTPTEALRRACIFDPISFAWQTPECYDGEIASAFRSWDRWEYFADIKGREPVSEEVALRGEQDLFVRDQFHVTHCTFMWRQMHRAFTVLKHIDSHLNNYNHTLHCQRVLLEAASPRFHSQAIRTAAQIIYPRCIPVEESFRNQEGDVV
jgi:hypothetical protein